MVSESVNSNSPYADLQPKVVVLIEGQTIRDCKLKLTMAMVMETAL